jgi:hypothetical protein
MQAHILIIINSWAAFVQSSIHCAQSSEKQKNEIEIFCVLFRGEKLRKI